MKATINNLVISYTRINKVLSFSTLGYCLVNLGMAFFLGVTRGFWHGMYSILGMLFWFVAVLFSFRWLANSPQGLKEFLYLLGNLFIVGSLGIGWKGLSLPLAFAGLMLILLTGDSLLKGKWMARGMAYSLFIVYILVVQSVMSVTAVDIRGEPLIQSLLDGVVLVFLAPLTLRWLYLFQRHSLRNRFFLVLMGFSFVPLLILVALTGSSLLSFLGERSAAAYLYGLGLIAFVAVGYLISGKILKPLSELAAMVKLGKEELVETQLRAGGSDEIAEISSAMGRLIVQLKAMAASLEIKVTERTYTLERKLDQLHRAMATTRELSSIRDVEDLIHRSVNLLVEQFGFDHALLFLLDDRGEYLILASAAGFRVDELFKKAIRVRVGSSDPVGIVAASGKPRMVKEVGLYEFEEYLPNTQSRMILPLKAGARNLGVLDVHSDQPDSFSEEIQELLTEIAGQLAIALDNAKLFQQLQMNLRELEVLTGRYTYESWKSARKIFGYKDGYVYQGAVIRRSDTKPLGFTEEASLVSPSSVQIPITLRDQTIGTIQFRFDESEPDPEMVATLREMTQRLALIMENARLVMEARNLAAREQQINQITSQIRSSVNVESILRNAVQELGKAFGASRAFVQIGLTPAGQGPAEPDTEEIGET